MAAAALAAMRFLRLCIVVILNLNLKATFSLGRVELPDIWPLRFILLSLKRQPIWHTFQKNLWFVHLVKNHGWFSVPFKTLHLFPHRYIFNLFYSYFQCEKIIALVCSDTALTSFCYFFLLQCLQLLLCGLSVLSFHSSMWQATIKAPLKRRKKKTGLAQITLWGGREAAVLWRYSNLAT